MEINYLVIHCTASKEGQNMTVEAIDRLHKANGWKGIGYHYVVYIDGSIHKGRPESETGAHCNDIAPNGKSYNSQSLGICYVGGLDKFGKPKDTRTPQQKAAMRKLLVDLKQKYPKAQVLGHRDCGAKKACPCFNAKDEYADINLEIKP